MKNVTLIIALSTILIYSNQAMGFDQAKSKTQRETEQKTSLITQTIFGKPGLNLPAEDLNKVQELIYAGLNASALTLYQGAQQTIALLQQKKKELEETITQKKAKNDYVDQRLFHEQFIVNHIINYLTTFLERQYSQLPWYKKIFLYLSTFFNNQDAQALSGQIYWFIQYGIEHYLLNYDKLLTFYAGTKKTPFPHIINFWQEREKKKGLQRRASMLNHGALVQQWSELLTIGIQSLVLGGESMYKQWLDQDAAARFAQLQDQLKKIQSDFQIYVKRLEDDQQNVIKTINNAFVAGQDAIKKKYQDLTTAQKQAVMYLLQAINLDAPINHYLMYPIIPWDQLFENGIMLTPDNGYIWYNVYQPRLANLGWGFDSSSNSFWQNALILFGIPLWDKSAEPTKVDPAQNSIFAEYVSPALQYDIEIEMQLINCTYPFFAGIFFNRARWISADPERIWQYRLVGLYGTQTDSNDPKTKKINLGFAQQLIMFQTDTKGNKTEQIISPLEQIATDAQKQLFALSAADVTQLDKEPITFSFAITTNPASVQITFSKITNGAKQQLYSTTISNLDNYIARFHGIGFMSPGCQAKFTIKKPEALMYTTDQLQAFNKQLGMLTKQGT